MNFPTSPAIGDQYAFADKTWQWNGEGWFLVKLVQWGDIEGTLSDQTDLQAALDAKADETITLTAGAGLTGGGDLSANRSFAVDLAYLAGAFDLLYSPLGHAHSGADITSGTVAAARLPTFGAAADGIVPASGGGTTNFLRADGTWTAPPGGGGGSVATDAIWDAKGDLAVGTGSDTASRLAVGTDGHVLTADSTQSTGVKWATPSGGGGSGPAYADLVLADSPTRFYKLDDTSGTTAVDSSGNSSNGTYNNAPTLNQTSLLYSGAGACVSFDGSNDTMTFSGGLNGALNSNALVVVDACLNITGTSLAGCFFSVMLDSGKNFALGVGSTTFSGAGNNLIALQQGNAYFASGVAIGTGNKHIAMAWSKGNSALYLFIDGVHVYTATTNSSTFAGADCVGGLSSGGFYFAGKIQVFATTYLQNVVAGSALATAITVVRRRLQNFKRGV
jgi:hypothetical protein